MLGAIDAGSNTLRLLIGEAAGDTVRPAAYHRRITRLAGGFTATEGLSRAARERALSAFQEFASACRREGVVKLRAVGTAAFRKAANGQIFAEAVRDRCGIDLEIISGTEEASLMTRGVLSALTPLPEFSLIIDIGGGSTELVLCERRTVVWQTTLPLGVVILTETMDGAARSSFIDKTIEQMLAELGGHLALPADALRLVGTAGTVTTLAALDMGMRDYDWRRVNNYTLGLDRIEHWRELLLPLSARHREALPGMEEGRGDLIMAGTEILLKIMQKLDSQVLTVSDFGILEGLLLSLANDRKR